MECMMDDGMAQSVQSGKRGPLIDLPSLAHIAAYIYGDASPSNIRRCRHLITTGRLPVRRRGNRYESSTRWLDELYVPDPAPSGSRK